MLVSPGIRLCGVCRRGGRGSEGSTPGGHGWLERSGRTWRTIKGNLNSVQLPRRVGPQFYTNELRILVSDRNVIYITVKMCLLFICNIERKKLV